MNIKTYLIPILPLLVSCNNNIEHQKLIGSWKQRDLIDQSNQNGSEKTIFYKDSLIVEMFANKKLTDKISAKYDFDTVSNVIHYKVENLTMDWKVLKLTDSEMKLQNTKDNKTIIFIRIE